MNKVNRLKIAAMILFWSGVIVESITLLGSTQEYLLHHTLFHNPESWFSNSFIVMLIIYYMFVHVAHITAGYMLSKGTKNGIVFGLAVGFYEIFAFFIPPLPTELFTPEGIGFRIFFAFVIYLILAGRKELGNLKSENWRPWKNPRRHSI